MRYDREQTGNRGRNSSAGRPRRPQDGQQHRDASYQPDNERHERRRTTLPFPDNERSGRPARKPRSFDASASDERRSNTRASRKQRKGEVVNDRADRGIQRADSHSDERMRERPARSRSTSSSDRQRRGKTAYERQQVQGKRQRSSEHEGESRQRQGRRTRDLDPFEPRSSQQAQRGVAKRASGGEQRRASKRPSEPQRNDASSRTRNAQPMRPAYVEDTPINYARNSSRYASQQSTRGKRRDQRQSDNASPNRTQGVVRASNYERDKYVKATSKQPSSHGQKSQGRGQGDASGNQTLLFGLVIVAAFLLAILILRFVVFSGTASEYGAVRAEIEQQNDQTLELETQNNELQAEINSMQGLIDQYNATQH